MFDFKTVRWERENKNKRQKFDTKMYAVLQDAEPATEFKRSG